jgi:hypothetical protein
MRLTIQPASTAECQEERRGRRSTRRDSFDRVISKGGKRSVYVSKASTFFFCQFESTTSCNTCAISYVYIIMCDWKMS